MTRPRSPSRTASAWRFLWAGPNSLLGLIGGAVLCLFGGRMQRVDDTLEFSLRAHPAELPPGLQRVPYRAITLGHVVLGFSAWELARHRAHERVHVRQYERWGPAFLPAYLLSGLWQALHGRRAYVDNPFEVEARCAQAQHAATTRRRRPRR